MIIDAKTAQFFGEVLSDAPAGATVFDPKCADRRIAVGEGEARVRERMCEISRIEIDTNLARPRPREPVREMRRFKCVAIDHRAAGLGVKRVQVETMRAG